MHKLLAIQLRKHLGIHAEEGSPIPGDTPLLRRLSPFLKAVDAGYTQFDRDLSLGHRSLIISNQELREMYERENRCLEQHLAMLEGLRRAAQQLAPDSGFPGQPELGAHDPQALLDLMDRLIRERTETRTHLETREAQYRSVLESLMEVVFQLDADGRWQFLNGAWTELTGFSVEESLGQPFHHALVQEDRPEILRQFDRLRTGVERTETLDVRFRTREEGTRWFRVRARAPQGGIAGISGTLTDITEQKRGETALLQAQKLESLGVLAGGIAHDFNNLLVAIMGNADLARQRLQDRDPSKAEHHLLQVSAAIERAAELCRQLLAYSGKGRFTIETLDVNTLVREMAHLLRVSISKKVSLDYRLAEGLPAIEADPSQIRQAVMNLVINASEAIGDQDGRILVETGLGRMSNDPALHDYLSYDMEAGPCVYVRIQDDGCGIDEETLKRIFDPFFTTKFTGRGLGLAAILGIVRSHKGSLRVDSRVNEGTTFCLQFPVSSRTAAVQAPAEPAGRPLRGQGLVLLVDDEPTVREIVAEALEVMGFTVAEASDGQAGVEAFAARRDEFIAVLLDLTMPVMGGEEAFRRIQLLSPGVPIILMSGYSEQEATSTLNSPGLAGFLQKPFKLLDLSRELQRVLATSQPA